MQPIASNPEILPTLSTPPSNGIVDLSQNPMGHPCIQKILDKSEKDYFISNMAMGGATVAGVTLLAGLAASDRSQCFMNASSTLLSYNVAALATAMKLGNLKREEKSGHENKLCSGKFFQKSGEAQAYLALGTLWGAVAGFYLPVTVTATAGGLVGAAMVLNQINSSR